MRSVSAERISAFPDLYPGEWIELLEMQYYPAVGYLYDVTTGFYPAAPYPSWTRDTNTKRYNAPMQMPTDEKLYMWDETSLQWSELS